mmetsp:Transcript_46261/g.108564  ORF Transcript_46261/g.108564 Transcript_46261/m.108564 type:complete len:215 (-) Transcript_46261:1249-1893(-)
MRPLRGHDEVPLGHNVVELQGVLVEQEQVRITPDRDLALALELEELGGGLGHVREDALERPQVMEVHLPQELQHRLGVGRRVPDQAPLLIVGRQRAVRVRRDHDVVHWNALGQVLDQGQLRLDSAAREVNVTSLIAPLGPVRDQLLAPLHVSGQERLHRDLRLPHNLPQRGQVPCPRPHVAVHHSSLPCQHAPDPAIRCCLRDGVRVRLRATVV